MGILSLSIAFIHGAFSSFSFQNTSQIHSVGILSKKVTHSVAPPLMTSLRSRPRVTHLPQTHSRKTLPYHQRWVTSGGPLSGSCPSACSPCMKAALPRSLDHIRASPSQTELARPGNWEPSEAGPFPGSWREGPASFLDGTVTVPAGPRGGLPYEARCHAQQSGEPASGWTVSCAAVTPPSLLVPLSSSSGPLAGCSAWPLQPPTKTKQCQALSRVCPAAPQCPVLMATLASACPRGPRHGRRESRHTACCTESAPLPPASSTLCVVYIRPNRLV